MPLSFGAFKILFNAMRNDWWKQSWIPHYLCQADETKDMQLSTNAVSARQSGYQKSRIHDMISPLH